MPRLPIDLPRMQNQPRIRAPVTRSPDLAPLEVEPVRAEPRKRLMRQYELVGKSIAYSATKSDCWSKA